MKRVVDYIIETLYAEGAKHIFFVPGTGCMHLTDALAKLKEVKAISCHHEQAAAMAALSYAKYNENIGACVVTTGCGGTNTMTGLLHAWQDNVPCVFVSGQAARNQTLHNCGLEIRQMGRQEADIVRLVKPITKYAVMLNDAKDVVYHVEKAIYLARSGRKGPVWIDVPLDIQNALINPDELEHFVPDSNENIFCSNQEDVEYVYQALSESKRPIVLAGNGVRLGNAIDALNLFVESYRIPVTYTTLGTDFLETENPLSIGMVGMLGASRAGNFALANSDLVLVLGSRLSIDTTGYEYNKFARAAKVIVVDIDKVEHSKNTVRIDKFILSDVLYFLSELNKKTPRANNEEWCAKCKHWKDIFPICTTEHRNSKDINMYYFMECLSASLPKNSAVVSDAGNAFFITSPGLKLKKGQRSITSGAQAEMGYGLPGAIGVSYACSGPVVAITGDGSFMMNLQELETVSYNKPNVKICVMNNNGYSSIRNLQNNAFRGRLIGTDPSCGLGMPSFKKIAEAFDLPYLRIEGSDNLVNKVKQIFSETGPLFCEVICTPNQDFLTVSTALNSKKRFVNRPLEDLAPFIDRETFLSEMIIEPIDQ